MIHTYSGHFPYRKIEKFIRIPDIFRIEKIEKFICIPDIFRIGKN